MTAQPKRHSDLDDEQERGGTDGLRSDHVWGWNVMPDQEILARLEFTS